MFGDDDIAGVDVDANDPSSWAPGQRPPWLDAYGPPPMDSSAVGGPDVPVEPGAVPAPDAQPGTPSIPPPIDASIPGAPGAQQFQPPWLQSEPQTGRQPAPEADTISGVNESKPGITTDQALTPTVVDPNAPLADRQKAWQALSPQQRTYLANNADPKQMAAIATADMDQKDLATIGIRHQQAQIHEQSARMLDLQRQADMDARANMVAYQQSVQKADADTAQVSADAMKLAQTKIDPQEHGVGHFIASVLLSGIGGAMSQYTGGRNLALEELDKQTQRRIDAQRSDLENQWKGIGIKRNVIAEELQRHGDLYRAQVTYQVSQYDRAASELQTQMQDYDPAGTTALRGATAIQQIGAQRQAALVAFNQQQQKSVIELHKEAREQMLAESTVSKNKAEIAKTYAETSKLQREGTAAAQQDAVHSPDDFRAMGLVPPPAPMNAADYTRWTGMLKSGNEAAKTATENEANRNAGLIRNPVTKQPLANPLDQSKQLVFPPEKAGEINDQIGATQSAIDNLSAARRALDADPGTFNRKEWAKIQSNIAQSFPQLAKVYGEKYSARTEEALKDVLNLDYDSYRKRVTDKGIGKATIDNTIETLVRNGNTTLGTKLGYDADKNPLFLDTSRPPESPKTPIDVAQAKVEASTSDQWTAEDHAIQKMRAGGGNPATAGRVLLDYGVDVNDPKFKADLKRVTATNVPISKLRLLDDLHDKAVHGSPDEQTKALAAINDIASTNEGDLGDIAKALATSVLVEGIPIEGKP